MSYKRDAAFIKDFSTKDYNIINNVGITYRLQYFDTAMKSRREVHLPIRYNGKIEDMLIEYKNGNFDLVKEIHKTITLSHDFENADTTAGIIKFNLLYVIEIEFNDVGLIIIDTDNKNQYDFIKYTNTKQAEYFDSASVIRSSENFHFKNPQHWKDLSEIKQLGLDIVCDIKDLIPFKNCLTNEDIIKVAGCEVEKDITDIRRNYYLKVIKKQMMILNNTLSEQNIDGDNNEL